jgi:ubiquinone/menaquinone biosynthesis C-methylase UbiE
MFRLKQMLKIHPIVFKMAQIIYWKSQEQLERSFGTRIQERKWSKRHTVPEGDWDNRQKYFGKRDVWVLSYWDSRNHEHRKCLMKEIEEYLPISSILEIGSNCGPNLYLVSKKMPTAKIVGIDINKRAIEVGKEKFKRENIENVELSVSKADDLTRFQSNSFDVVLTDAVLIYIGPDKIRKIIMDMIRIAKKAIILVEQHTEEETDNEGLGIYHSGLWRRNYRILLRQFVSEDKLRFVKIPDKSWEDKEWKRSGYIIKVNL